jgi:hypothetical protein
MGHVALIFIAWPRRRRRRVLPTQALRSRHVSAGTEASRHARIPSPPVEPPVLVLWLNQVTRRFCGQPPQTPRADSGLEPLLRTVSCPLLYLVFLTTMRPALDPTGHRVPQASLLLSPLLEGPARHRPFARTLHLHQRKSSRNLHLQYSAKSQSTPRCQSLITARSDHPPVLRRSGPQTCSMLDNHVCTKEPQHAI